MESLWRNGKMSKINYENYEEKYEITSNYHKAKKKTKKTKHKHIYEPCWLKNEYKNILGNTFNIDTFDNSYITLVNYCPICGKIRFSDPNNELNEDALTIRWRSVFYDKKKEVYEKYKNIPLFESHDAFPSKVDLQQKRNIREEDINL